MATEIETWVLNLLSAIEVPRNAPEQIESAGTEAINVACEAALGTYVGLRPKLRTNAAWVVGRMTSQQARETLMLLLNDPSDDVAIRAIRAIGKRNDPELEARAALTLQRPEANSLVVAEIVKSLGQSQNGKLILSEYRGQQGLAALPHRRSPVVERALRSVQW